MVMGKSSKFVSVVYVDRCHRHLMEAEGVCHKMMMEECQYMLMVGYSSPSLPSLHVSTTCLLLTTIM